MDGEYVAEINFPDNIFVTLGTNSHKYRRHC